MEREDERRGSGRTLPRYIQDISSLILIMHAVVSLKSRIRASKSGNTRFPHSALSNRDL
jgi:hypothetical protein